MEAPSEPTWGIEKVPPTSAGARYQHNYTPGVHAEAFVWRQDLVENPNIPDPFKVGWLCDADKISVPILSDIAITPESVVELVRCGCEINKCSRRCSCRRHYVTCTEACSCGAAKECTNTAVYQLRNLKILMIDRIATRFIFQCIKVISIINVQS